MGHYDRLSRTETDRCISLTRPSLGLPVVTSDMQRAADLLYHRIVVYLIIVVSLRPFTCKDLLQYFGKCKQVFFCY